MAIDFGAMGSGFAERTAKHLDDKDDRAFKMKLQSAQIEGQLANAQKLHDYTKASAKTTASIFGDSGIPTTEGERESVPALGLLAGKQKAAAALTARENASANRLRSRMMRPRYVSVNNVRMMETMEEDPVTGDWKPVHTPIGTDPAAFRKYADFSSEAEGAYARLDSIRGAVTASLSDKDFLSRIPNMAEMTLEKMLGSKDTRAVALIDTIDASALAIAAVINKGRPSEADALAVKKAMPLRGDTFTRAKAKLDQLESILTRTEKRYHSMLINGEVPTPRADRGGGGTYSVSDIDAELKRQGFGPDGKPLKEP